MIMTMNNDHDNGHDNDKKKHDNGHDNDKKNMTMAMILTMNKNHNKNHDGWVFLKKT